MTESLYCTLVAQAVRIQQLGYERSRAPKRVSFRLNSSLRMSEQKENGDGEKLKTFDKFSRNLLRRNARRLLLLLSS